MNILEKLHPVTKRFPDGFITGNTELYNNMYVLDTVVPLISGVQGKKEANPAFPSSIKFLVN